MDAEFPTKDFYNFSLYRLPENQIQPKGNLQSTTAIIVPPFQDENERLFLAKVLQAVGIANLEDILLLEIPLATPFSWATFAPHTQAQNWLIFARTGISIGWQFDCPFYKPHNIPPHHQFLFCESLAIIQADTNKKRALWESLKQVFK